MAEEPSELNVMTSDQVSTVADRDESRIKDSMERYELEAVTDDVAGENEAIKAQIEATRNQMGETIDAIQERLSFANISEQVSETVSNAIESAKDSAYAATIGKAVNFMKNVGNGVNQSDALRVIKNNPLPLALIGVGAGLLVYQSLGRGGSSRSGNGRDYTKGYYDRETEGGSTFGSAKRSIAGTASKAYEGISDKAGGAVEGISDVAGTAYESVAGAVGSAYTGAGDIAHKAYDRAGEFGTIAHDKYDQYLEENPLVLGAMAVAVGAAVGFAIPSTNYEGRLMGEARENLMERAQDAAGTLVDKAKQVATEAGQTIKSEAQAFAK